MSERYGPVGELKELLSFTEDWLDEKIDDEQRKILEGITVSEVRWAAARQQAFREVKELIVVNPDG